jgi:hypothetical protein
MEALRDGQEVDVDGVLDGRDLAVQIRRHAQSLPSGVVLRRARVQGTMDLSFLSLPGQLRITNSTFEMPFDLEGASVGLLDLGGSRLPGLQADGIQVGKDVFLDEGVHASGSIRLIDSVIGGQLSCQGTFNPAQAPEGFGGAAIEGDGSTIRGGVFIGPGTYRRGARFTYAKIGRSLAIEGDLIAGETDDLALLLDASDIGGDVIIEEDTRIRGTVSMVGASIGGELNVRGFLVRHNSVAHTILADGMHVGQGANFDGPFRSSGSVRLIGAAIGGQLSFAGARISSADAESAADSNYDRGIASTFGEGVCGDRISVAGNVLFVDNFSSKGSIRLSHSDISGQLVFRDAHIVTRLDQTAVSCQAASVGAGVFFSGAEIAGGIDFQRSIVQDQLAFRDTQLPSDSSALIDLTRIRIAGTLTWRPASRPGARVDLSEAQVETLDDRLEYWPVDIDVRDFEYETIGPTSDRDVGKRLDFVGKSMGQFSAQTYDQLARVYERLGSRDAVRIVRIAREESRWRSSAASMAMWQRALADLARVIFRATTSYGYEPMRAGIFLLGFSALGSVVFGVGFFADRMVPVELTVEQAFAAPVYSLDLLLPVVDLGQVSSWVIGYDGSWLAWALLCAYWSFVFGGWILTTAFLAGVATVVRRDD